MNTIFEASQRNHGKAVPTVKRDCVDEPFRRHVFFSHNSHFWQRKHFCRYIPAALLLIFVPPQSTNIIGLSPGKIRPSYERHTVRIALLR